MEVGHYYLLDTFADVPFQGSPTPVCMLSELLDAPTMHQLAQELNAPVTAFVKPSDVEGDFMIRYFTTEGEIPACGHATLGAAFVLLTQETSFNKIKFVTIEGIRPKAQITNDLTYIEYPRFPHTIIDIPPKLLEALGMPTPLTHFYSSELQSLFIELDNPNEVNRIQPNFELLKQSTDDIKEVVVMSKSNDEAFDFILRSFCPWIGINEDPVTGSIHSVLGPYWQKQTNKSDFAVYQASERGGKIFVKTFDDHVALGGHCKILVAGKLLL
ncbi:hypothetical protein BKI52_00320 [marine bacterium AO1-C]|nr:hypothetical protein BKI52_00320 [marine bacterium AO1-C]